MVLISEQAKTLINNFKDFNEEDFEKFTLELPKITIQGSNSVIQYVEMKNRGLWNDGKFKQGE